MTGANDVTELKKDLDDFFLIVMGMIVFFMQCGFAFLEAGAVRAKNTTNILFKNVMDCAVAGILYWSVGYAFAFGDDAGSFIGHSNFFLINLPADKVSFYFFQYVFAATSATIVSGAMAERTNIYAYFIYSFVMSAIVYPIPSHWVWSGKGWLASKAPWDDVTYMDFAGSSVVHAVGGMGALMGAIALGPRIGFRNFELNKNQRIRGHTIPLMSLGGIILFFGFFAFNGGSQLAISNPGDGQAVAKAILNTVLSGYSAGITCVFFYKIKRSNFSLLMCINGTLTGMVAICAGCNVVEPWGALVTGFIAAGVFMLVSEGLFFMGVDDPLDAVAVHLGGGVWGVLSAPFFARDDGILYNWNGRSFQILLWNFIGLLVIIAWTGLLTGCLFWGLRLIKLLRVDRETEETGLDSIEHGEPAYDLEILHMNSGSEPAKEFSDVKAVEIPRATSNGHDNYSYYLQHRL